MGKGIFKNVVLSVDVAKILLKILDKRNAGKHAQLFTLSDLIREGIDLLIEQENA